MSRFLSLSALSAVCLAALALVAVPSAAVAQTETGEMQAEVTPAPEGGGAETCMRCHDEPPTTLILHTPHALQADGRTPFANGGCQTCHGASEQHMVKPAEGEPRAEPDIVFGKFSPNSADEQNAVCMGCHEGGKRMNWPMSQHDSAEVPCASCHKPHNIKDPVTVKQDQAQVCYDCHATQRAQSFKRSRHPIREGKVVCSDCHNPHGSWGPTLLAENTVNETCYECHQEKRGPFLWEHAPVTDDCTNCHTPHGSNQRRLLKIRNPFLCQTCHSEAFHPSTLYDGNALQPGGSSRLLFKGCLNCHPKIHGTNHPSGPRLTR